MKLNIHVTASGLLKNWICHTNTREIENVFLIWYSIVNIFLIYECTFSQCILKISLKDNYTNLLTRLILKDYDLSYFKEYNSFLSCKAIIVKVSLGVRFLISEVVVDSEYEGHAKGLMGNFDGNPTNDFILPNGTILNKNSTRTEREIYNNFGQQCKISFDRKTYMIKNLSM